MEIRGQKSEDGNLSDGKHESKKKNRKADLKTIDLQIQYNPLCL